MEIRPTVFIPNQGGHDFSKAKEFGDLCYLTKGELQKFNTTSMYRKLATGMKDATEEDYLLVSSLSILNGIAFAIQARKFGKLKLLIFGGGRYVERVIDIDSLLDD
jgi:hypothetical protein